MFAVDDGRDDIGRQRRKPQQAREVADGEPLLAGYRRHGQIGILHQTLLKVVRASDDPKQTWIGFCPILGVVHDQLHLAADALESRLHLEFQNIVGGRLAEAGPVIGNSIDCAWSRS